ncbi:hypothetical protein FQN57_005672, partial [Myotisia sp. PD_48]
MSCGFTSKDIDSHILLAHQLYAFIKNCSVSIDPTIRQRIVQEFNWHADTVPAFDVPKSSTAYITTPPASKRRSRRQRWRNRGQPYAPEQGSIREDRPPYFFPYPAEWVIDLASRRTAIQLLLHYNTESPQSNTERPSTPATIGEAEVFVDILVEAQEQTSHLTRVLTPASTQLGVSVVLSPDSTLTDVDVSSNGSLRLERREGPSPDPFVDIPIHQVAIRAPSQSGNCLESLPDLLNDQTSPILRTTFSSIINPFENLNPSPVSVSPQHSVGTSSSSDSDHVVRSIRALSLSSMSGPHESPNVQMPDYVEHETNGPPPVFSGVH